MKDSLIHSLYAVIFKYFRKRRFHVFQQRIRPVATDRILDVGGYQATWAGHEQCAQEISILNIHEVNQTPSSASIHFVTGDGCSLSYADRSFDIVFSNSVIEHVGDWERQKAFALEVRRVGSRLWIQTPAREFWIEPHLLTPFIHWLPISWRVRLAKNFTLWGWLARPTQSEAEAFVRDITLLSFDEMQSLFPDCEIIREKILFGLMTKSYIAFRS